MASDRPSRRKPSNKTFECCGVFCKLTSLFAAVIFIVCTVIIIIGKYVSPKFAEFCNNNFLDSFAWKVYSVGLSVSSVVAIACIGWSISTIKSAYRDTKITFTSRPAVGETYRMHSNRSSMFPALTLGFSPPPDGLRCSSASLVQPPSHQLPRLAYPVPPVFPPVPPAGGPPIPHAGLPKKKQYHRLFANPSNQHSDGSRPPAGHLQLPSDRTQPSADGCQSPAGRSQASAGRSEVSAGSQLSQKKKPHPRLFARASNQQFGHSPQIAQSTERNPETRRPSDSVLVNRKSADTLIQIDNPMHFEQIEQKTKSKKE